MKNSKFAFIISMMCIFIPSLCEASFKTGNNIYSIGKKCYPSNGEYECSFYQGYVAGMYDAYSGIQVCAPFDVTLGQIKDMFYKHLRDNPEIRHENADYIFMVHFRSIFPCKDK